MNTHCNISSPSMARTLASVILVFSANAWSADHREAPSISFIDYDQTSSCPATLGLPMRISFNVPAEVLKRANITLDLYTRNDNGLVDASDYIVWRQSMGPTLSLIVNPGDKPRYSQLNEGYITLPSMKREAYPVRFRFESITDGESCDLAGRVDYGLANAAVIYWSSGAVRHTD